jgi:hypothetical protein
MNQALIITGMHRSGTSFVAELFKSAGLHIGERLFPGDTGNPRGYFEDEDILILQRTMLAKACPAGTVGWPDWGWTDAETLDESVWANDEPAMRALAKERERLPVWGWKDPRTTLLLEQWLHVLPDACFLFVVREPWKVAASVQRLPSELFRTRPEVGVRIWLAYNRRLLDFARKHPERCVIMPMPWLANTPHSVLTHAITKLGLDGLRFDAKRSREILEGRKQDAQVADAEHERSFRLEYRDAVVLWQQLLAAASGL